MMKKLCLTLCAMGMMCSLMAQNDSISRSSYKLVKLDLLNLMGISIQKAHLGFEFSPFKQNYSNIPTVQVDVQVPFNSLNDLNIHTGLEVAAQLRFYQINKHRINAAEGLYVGIAMDGGWTSFARDYDYSLDGGFGVSRTYTHEYNRVKTGVYALIGAQTKLSEKVYFDANLGMGWSNVNVVQKNIEIDPNYYRVFEWEVYNPFYSLFDEGKYQSFYMPISFSIGYNFGTK